MRVRHDGRQQTADSRQQTADLAVDPQLCRRQRMSGGLVRFRSRRNHRRRGAIVDGEKIVLVHVEGQTSQIATPLAGRGGVRSRSVWHVPASCVADRRDRVQRTNVRFPAGVVEGCSRRTRDQRANRVHEDIATPTLIFDTLPGFLHRGGATTGRQPILCSEFGSNLVKGGTPVGARF